MLRGVVPTACSEETRPGVPSETQVPDTKITLEQATDDLNKLLESLKATKGTRFSKADRKIANAYAVNLNEVSSRGSIRDSIDDTYESSELGVGIYVINFAEKKGFAMMANDERLPALFILADSGNLAKDEVITHPGLAIVLERIDALLANLPWEPNPDVVCPTVKYGPWSETFYNGAECDVTWGQSGPYSMYCPNDEYGAKTLAGCVPVAVAQLMSVHHYPNQYGPYEFNWDEMTKYPEAKHCTADIRSQIARLIKEVGTLNNLHVDYGVESSSADPRHIERTFKAFGYKNGGDLKDYSESNVVTELKNGYPVILRGNSKRTTILEIFGWKVINVYSGGHSWLGHGLMERKREIKYYTERGLLDRVETQRIYYPLCNWGWEGDKDGYYLSNVFNSNLGPERRRSPDSDSDDGDDGGNGNYQFNVQAVTGIRPY